MFYTSFLVICSSGVVLESVDESETEAILQRELYSKSSAPQCVGGLYLEFGAPCAAELRGG